MSVTLSEFLNAWNETMSVQIREADIKNPNESNFRRWLITILRTFFVNTQAYENMDNESGNRLRTLRVHLVATVNHFYKIAFPGAKQDFVFFDLIQPTFKRVFNVLNCLLNYCAFVRHTYASTILDLKGKLRERDELRSVKHQMLTEIEQAKIKQEMNERSIKDLEAKIPRQKVKNEELEEKEKRMREEIAKIQVECEKSDLHLMEVKTELANIKSLAVSDQEIESIISAKENIEKQLEEQDQITAAGRQKLYENSHAIEEAQAITVKMEALHSSFNIDASDIKTKKKQVEDMKLEINSFKANISSLAMDIESLSQTLEMKNENVSEMIKKRDEVKKFYGTKEAEQRKELKEKENLLRKLTTQEAALSSSNQRLRDEQELLFKVASNVIKHISSQIFEDKSQE